MRYYFRNGGAFFLLAVGSFFGFFAAGLWPNTPLHTMATDKIETFGICTGLAEDGYEAIYFLDYLTGDLYSVVVGRGSNGYGVLASASANVLKDLNVDAGKNPKLLMVTGMSDLLRGGKGGGLIPSRSVIYVADVTSGMCAVYAMPCNSTAHARGVVVQKGNLFPIASFKFRNAAPKGGE
jgi:hypothetical protein